MASAKDSHMETEHKFSPIADRCGHSGGIESLMLDDVRQYFGYDHDNKVILSSLFKDPDDMAAYASQYMRQQDGKGDIAAWRELAEDSETHSSLCTSPLVLKSTDLIKIAASLRLAITADQCASFSINEHAITLLRAACDGPPDGRLDAMFMLATVVTEELTGCYEGDAVRWAMDVVYDRQPFPWGMGLTCAQIARALQRYLSRLARMAPGNWREVFSALVVAEDSATLEASGPTPQQVTAVLSPQCPFRAMRYAEISDQVPEDSDVYWLESDEVETEENLVLYVEGDLHLDRLNLDDPLSPWREGDDGGAHPWFILVTGNVVIEQHIWSLETDGACGLIVLGNLTARNAMVGGQQVFVGGDLDIAELYWGDYNHGCMYVRGDTKAALLIQTDYDMTLLGKVTCLKRIDDLDAFDGEELKRIIAPECVLQVEPEPAAAWDLDASAMLELLEAGKCVISMEALSEVVAPFSVPSIFSDVTVSPDNFLRLAAPDLMPLEKVETWMYQFDRDGLQLTVMVSPAGKDGTQERSIIMEDLANGFAVCFSMVREPLPRTWKDVLLFRPRQYGWALLKATCDDFKADEPEWCGVVGDTFTPTFTQLILKGWSLLLEGASSRHWAAGQITPAEVRALLALPVAAPYDDYNSDDRNGFWLGSLHASFRHENNDDSEKLPIFRLTRAYVDSDGETKYENFYYDVECCMDGEERVRIRYLDDQDSDVGSVPLDLIGSQRLNDAIRLFRRGAAQLKAANDALLEGNPPQLATDDEFAMQYWREQGFILMEPKVDQEACMWLSASAGDAQYQKNDYELARNSFLDALKEPGGIENPFVHYRLGQCQWKLGNEALAVESLLKAYMLDGEEIFMVEDDGASFLTILQERSLID
ncbi:hypothetical protein D3C80_656730 [compost metagenome]